MNIEIPFHFLERIRIAIDWDDIAFAYDNGLIDSRTVIAYASHDLSKRETVCQTVVDLACSQPSDSLAGLLAKLTTAEFEPGDSRKKWAFILAAYIAERDDLDQLTEIENVYSSFDYPCELSSFIRYMPMVGPDLGSTPANEQRMIASLKDFAKTIVDSCATTTNNGAEGER